MQSGSVSEDERSSVCSWTACTTAAEAWNTRHYSPPGTVCHRTGKAPLLLLLLLNTTIII